MLKSKTYLPFKERQRRRCCCVSSNSSGLCQKTVYTLKFQSKDNTDVIMMWWLAKNGSTSLGLESKEPAFKRKCKTKWEHGSGYYTPEENLKHETGALKDFTQTHNRNRKGRT